MAIWIFGQTSAIFHTFIQKGISRLWQWQICMWHFFFFSQISDLQPLKKFVYSINDNQFSHFVLVKNTAVCCIFGFSQGINVSISVKISWISRLELFLVIKTAQKSLLKTSSLMLDFLRNYWNQEVDFFFSYWNILNKVDVHSPFCGCSFRILLYSCARLFTKAYHEDQICLKVDLSDL